jgi:membrane-associated phospholipid phosphatase
VEPWDVLAATMYMLHFLVPLVAGFLLWWADREMFQRFAAAFVLVALAGFATYIVFPAVPPWMAAEPLVHASGTYIVHSGGHIYLPGIQNLFNVAMGHWYNPNHGTILFPFLHLHYDKVAAIPSEHAMYPMLFFLFLRRKFGRPAYLCLIYILLLLFSITYLGQHYVTDAVVGFAYAVAGYLVVMHVAPAMSRWFERQPIGLVPAPVRADIEEA